MLTYKDIRGNSKLMWVYQTGTNHGYYGLAPLHHRRRPYRDANVRRAYNLGFISGRQQRRLALLSTRGEHHD